MKKSESEIAGIIKILGALDSPLRLRIVLLLNEREHYVHELVSTLEKSQPLISQHLRVLKKAGIVESERAGREVTYRLVTPDIMQLVEMAQSFSYE